ncbi:zf-HC2 domain-containing protein [Paenibacillus sp. GP183]|jgi:hypothetical protein|uniref:anti-sigma factor family protein n=1 Tax=Paenibacillus sp. GP183 TaxID=1882751 RepID=UPI00089994C1|nr:zf-HC2 domain-containing protein [Paenibacillus sp. GP183]SEB63977.1 Putative zinc-finger [Paenibacillus sp. GP183]
MKCSDIQELFGDYWDLPNDDLRRAAVDSHIKTCPSCKEEFQIWEESTVLIRSAVESKAESDYRHAVSDRVMTRIYHDESWRIPVPNRMYAISHNLRRNLTTVIAFSLALFVVSFLFSILNDRSTGASLASSGSSMNDLQAPKVFVPSDNSASLNGHSLGTAVASLNTGFMEPLRFNVGPIHSYPHYLLVVSILGLIATMLIMNWFSRTKA